MEYTKIEAVNKGICSTKIPRNQTLRIYLVPNREKMFNEAMRRTDLTAIGYGHVLSHLVHGLSFLSCTRLWPVLIPETIPMPWSLGGCRAMAGLSDTQKDKAPLLTNLRHWDQHVVWSEIITAAKSSCSRKAQEWVDSGALLEASFISHLCAGSIWWV